MKKIILLILFFSFTIAAFSQKWKAERKAFVFGIGYANYLGDLGGGSRDGAHLLSVRDVDISKTRPAAQFGFWYRITKDLAVKTGFSFAMLSGSDTESQNEGRKVRNLNFRTNTYEVFSQLEYYFLPERDVPRFVFSSLKSSSFISAYALLGFGVFNYNPQGKYNGTWYDLKPLATEGEGLNIKYKYNIFGTVEEISTPKKYNGIAISMPIGLGIKYAIDRKWCINIEIISRYTSTDYLDDTHDRYFNYNQMKAQGLVADFNPMSQIFADRHLKFDGTPVDQNVLPPKGDVRDLPYNSGRRMRGNPNFNDAYILTMISVHYKFANFVKSAKY